MRFERKGNQIRFLDTDGINFDVWTKILNHLNYLNYGMPDENSCKQYFNRGTWLNEDQSLAVLKILGEEHESNVYDQEKIKRDNKAAIKAFGTTNIWRKAGYLLTTGELLDFSEGQDTRSEDHRFIKIAMEDEFEGYSDAMIQFMNYGNIRCHDRGIDLTTEPTQKQKNVLSSFFRNAALCYVDISNHDGFTVQSFQYEIVRPSKVFEDIENFFMALQ